MIDPREEEEVMDQLHGETLAELDFPEVRTAMNSLNGESEVSELLETLKL